MPLEPARYVPETPGPTQEVVPQRAEDYLYDGVYQPKPGRLL